MSRAARAVPVPATPFEAAVGARIDGLTSWRHRLVPPVLLGLVMLFDSWDAVVTAQVMPALIHGWRLDPVMTGWLISAGYAGQFLGAFVFGPFAERHGRMPVLHVALTLMSVLAIACALAPNYDVLMALRFVQGLAIGGALPLAITYISELAPAPIRGRYFALFQFLTMSGYTLASLVGILVIPAFGWRWMFAIGAMPLLLLPAVAMILPESPRWLARRGRVADANRALARLGAAEVTGVLPADHVETAARHERVSPLALFAAAHRRDTLIILPVWLLSSVVVFGVVNWATVIHTSFYHVSHATALGFLATAGLCYLALAPVIGSLTDRIGRRRLGMLCTAVSVAALGTLTLFNPMTQPVPAILIHGGSIGLSVMVSMILYTYSAERFPTRVRATALGFFSSMNRLSAMFVPLLIGGVIKGTGSIQPVFALFTACALAILLIFVFLIRETAGRSLEEI